MMNNFQKDQWLRSNNGKYRTRRANSGGCFWTRDGERERLSTFRLQPSVSDLTPLTDLCMKKEIAVSSLRCYPTHGYRAGDGWRNKREDSGR